MRLEPRGDNREGKQPALAMQYGRHGFVTIGGWLLTSATQNRKTFVTKHYEESKASALGKSLLEDWLDVTRVLRTHDARAQ